MKNKLSKGKNDVLKNEFVNNKDDCAAVPLPTDIGREFVRQYYTKWSTKSNDIHLFYGYESSLLHDGHEAKGQEAIQKLIQSLNYDNCKARIHSVVGVSSTNDSLSIQVCGELSTGVNFSPRRFIQSFVLCKQATKSYYVQTDVFQWLDKAFCTVENA